MAKILIVDDDVNLVAMLTDFFQTLGHEVKSAGDPVQGMLMARKEKPELMILDYQMPRDTGAHLFESLRRNQATKDLPVIFMSGSMPPARLLDEISSSANARFLSKPVELATLKQAIGEILKPS